MLVTESAIDAIRKEFTERILDTIAKLEPSANKLNERSMIRISAYEDSLRIMKETLNAIYLVG